MTSYIYKIHHVPASDENLLPFLAGKFASLRLSALTVSAPAFSSTFEIESAFTASQWIERLKRPLVCTFVAVAYGAATPPEKQTIDAGDWIGSATLLGPFTKEMYEIPESGGPSIGSDEVESRWQMTAVFNSPDHRGKGIAKMLIQGALDFAAEQTGKGRSTRMRIMIHPRNVVVKKLYVGLGFVDAGNTTLAEAYLANGDAEMLPPDGGKSDPEKYHNRLGLIMERVSLPIS
ncbi:related to GNAT family acetyltransferase [Phialocephala subalpina]|uniref:Related to GNAT family acetyltransferase n=1 Tax=Phialocephala subalpina TaxID=576137 RepID=A0A1L7WDH9_9HELO|nr:related to GNAT family acetyltransferase [Phialocephala subalpina]